MKACSCLWAGGIFPSEARPGCLVRRPARVEEASSGFSLVLPSSVLTCPCQASLDLAVFFLSLEPQAKIVPNCPSKLFHSCRSWQELVVTLKISLFIPGVLEQVKNHSCHKAQVMLKNESKGMMACSVWCELFLLVHHLSQMTSEQR